MSDQETPWEFVPEDDKADSGDGSAEELAVHIEPVEQRPATDPGRSDVELGSPVVEALTGLGHFADEEPELTETRLVEDREPDVQELLERQGYASADEIEETVPVVEAEAVVGLWRRHLESERQRLVDLRRGLTGGLPTGESQRELDSDLSTIDQHQADMASTTYELEVEHSLLHQIDYELEEVGEAFERIQAGAYGRCEMCDGPISHERLRAVPATRYCITHERLADGPSSRR